MTTSNSNTFSKSKLNSSNLTSAINTKSSHSSYRKSTYRQLMEPQTARPKYSRNFWDKMNDVPKKEVDPILLDKYYEKLKASRPKPAHQFKTFELQSNEIPQSLYSAGMKCEVKQPPKKMIQVFDKSHFYDCTQPPLNTYLPNSFIATSFKNYLEKNHERIPEILQHSFAELNKHKIATPVYDPNFPIDYDINDLE